MHSNACEQCGRNRLPAIHEPVDIGRWLDGLTSDALRLVLDPGAATGWPAVAETRQLVLLVGPEGGLTADERAMAINRGFQAVHLGPRILRTETAPLAAIAAMQALWGDFR